MPATISTPVGAWPTLDRWPESRATTTARGSCTDGPLDIAVRRGSQHEQGSQHNFLAFAAWLDQDLDVADEHSAVALDPLGPATVRESSGR